ARSSLGPPRGTPGPGPRSGPAARHGRRAGHDRMSGRAVLITGASRGIGRAIATEFAAAGDRVAVHHRDSAELADDLTARLPGSGHVVVQADLADPDAVRAMVDRAAGLLGGLDILVNNAGVFTPHPITGVSYQHWQQQWQAT